MDGGSMGDIVEEVVGGAGKGKPRGLPEGMVPAPLSMLATHDESWMMRLLSFVTLYI